MPPDAQLEAERARQALLLLCKCGRKKPGPFHECCAECWTKKKRRASMKKKALLFVALMFLPLACSSPIPKRATARELLMAFPELKTEANAQYVLDLFALPAR